MLSEKTRNAKKYEAEANERLTKELEEALATIKRMNEISQTLGAKAKAKLIVDSVNKVARYEELIREIKQCQKELKKGACGYSEADEIIEEAIAEFEQDISK